ncbi:UNVERIFIED_CONTAM: UTP--glucose-1-phosphate uridylyltransferase [Trichonephila clavipes]
MFLAGHPSQGCFGLQSHCAPCYFFNQASFYPSDFFFSINVPRSRFLPVKKTSDLLLVMSNLYSMRNGSLIMNPERSFQSTPLVKLGDLHFLKVRDFLSRFDTIPDMLELDHLTVSGDVTFGRGVSLKVSKWDNMFFP